MYRFRSMATVILLLAMAHSLSGITAEGLPEVVVTNIRRAFHNGEHNAFTDLIRFQDRYYLTFRSCPDGHQVAPTASIIVLESTDAEDWKQVCRFSVPTRDTRDPHFLIFQGKLFVYTGTWYCGNAIPRDPDMNQHLGYAVVSEDGRYWSEPIMLEGTYGHYIWRVAAFDGVAYLCGRRRHQFNDGSQSRLNRLESVMLESHDGVIFRQAHCSKRARVTRRLSSLNRTAKSSRCHASTWRTRFFPGPVPLIRSGNELT